jgi:PTS system N-acetylglucosamine-specific IIC component
MVTVTQKSFAGLQKLGRALMLPIAVMPLAALLLRLGQDDLLNIPFVAAAGDAIFANLGMLFAVGVAVGFAKETHGAAGLAGAVGYFVTTKGAVALATVPPDKVAEMVSWISIPVGILAGLIAGAMYNRFKDFKLPDYLAFFGGRRFVPIVTGFCCLGLAVVFGYGWPYVTAGLDTASRSVFAAGNLGLFVYGFLNRLLLVTGLHHIINNFAWLLLGAYHTVTGELVTGDLKRFFAGDPSAGAFMTGFFPVMMFGLPAACLAMYRTARTANRRLVGGVLLSMALTSFLTGVTEPVEFAFMFLAPVLYLIHAVLTGLALVIMNLLDVKLGFGFSAGLFDYILNFNKSTHPLLLLPIGAIYFAVYYGMFRYAIAKFDLKTIGREPEGTAPALGLAIDPGQAPGRAPGPLPEPATVRGASYLAALGGAANVLEVEACATRLRLSLVDNARLDEAALRQLGARGVLRPAAGSAQIIIGPLADQVAGEIQDAMRTPEPSRSLGA